MPVVVIDVWPELAGGLWLLVGCDCEWRVASDCGWRVACGCEWRVVVGLW